MRRRRARRLSPSSTSSATGTCAATVAVSGSRRTEDKRAAYLTLYECLLGAHKLMAPFLPFLAENVYQNLVRGNDSDAPESVHMGRLASSRSGVEE